MREDVLHAFRLLKRRGRFTLLAVSVLGICTGLNSAIFGVVHPVLFTHLPVSRPEELRSVYMTPSRQPDRPGVIHPAVFEAMRQRNEVFRDLTLHLPTTFLLKAGDTLHEVVGERVLANYFSVLGVSPAIGRPLSQDEDSVANPSRAVVISHRLWIRRFGGDPSVLGKEISLSYPWAQSGVRATIVGVMKPGFRGVSEAWRPTDLWVTFAQAGDGRAAPSGIAIGRLRSTVTTQQVQDRLRLIASDATKGVFRVGSEPGLAVLETKRLRVPSNPAAALVPLRLAVGILAVGLSVLLVAASNIVGIVLARGFERSAEIAIRRMIGASDWQIRRLVISETLILCAIGGALGLLLDFWLLQAFQRLMPEQLGLESSVDAKVLLFTLVTCTSLGLFIGLLPARQALRHEIARAATGRSGGISLKGRQRHVVTIPQIACSLGLLLLAGAQVRDLVSLEISENGYRTDDVLVANPQFPSAARIDRRSVVDVAAAQDDAARRARTFYQELLANLRSLPGGHEVAVSDRLPLDVSGGGSMLAARFPDPLEANTTGIPVDRVGVSPGYFRTMDIAMLSGRDFDDRDHTTSARVAVVSEKIASRLFPGADAVGGTVWISSGAAKNPQTQSYTVIGLVKDVKAVLSAVEVQPFIYVPLSQDWSPSSASVLVRSQSELAQIEPMLRQAIVQADHGVDVRRVRRLSEIARELLYPRRLVASVLAVAAGATILLTIVGIYGVISYSVAQRANEIGIRVALGASPRAVSRLIMYEAGLVGAVGCAIGLLIAVVTLRIVSNRVVTLSLPGVPLTLLSMAAMGSVIALSSYIPTRRTAHIDPAVTLRAN